MPNAIKYNVSAETLALKKGNFYIGTGDVGKGPTSSTGFYNGINPPSGGYTIYLNKVSNGPSIYVASSDAQLINLTNLIAGTSYTTVDSCFTYFMEQTDKLIWGNEVGAVITNGLQSFIDFSSTACYPRSGSKFYNLTNNGVGYIQSSTFSLSDSGKVVTTGGNDNTPNYVGSRININTTASGVDRFDKENNFTFAFWVKYLGNGDRIFSTGSAGSGTSDACIWQFWLDPTLFYWWNSGGGGTDNITASITTIPQNSWSYITITYSYNESGNNIIRVYRNGSSIGSGSTPTSTHSAIGRSGQTDLQYTLGGGYWSSCYTLNSSGEFAMFQVYNRTLSESETTTNYNNTKSRFGL